MKQTRARGDQMRAAIVQAIRTLSARHHRPPTTREIGAFLGGKSTGHLSYHLKILIDEGTLLHDARTSRGLLLADQAPAPLPAPTPRQARPIRLVGTIAAGRPIEAIEDLDSSIDLTAHLAAGDGLYALRVTGTSMIEDCIADGDVVLVRRQETADNGDTVVALLKTEPSAQGEATLKRFYREKGGRIRLQPANAAMAPLFVDEQDLQIQGKVVAVYRAV
jgi:repressor LexA